MTTIRRDELSQMLSDWKSGTLKGQGKNGRGGGEAITIENIGSEVIPLGGPIVITGRQTPDATAENARTEYLTNGIALRGRNPQASDFTSGKPVVATALEPIRASGCGEAVLPGIFAAEVTVTAATDTRGKLAETGYVTGTAGEYKIVARAGTFAFLVKDPEEPAVPKIKNTTTTDLVAGECLMVDWGLNDTGTTDELFAKYQADGVVLKGVQPTGSPYYALAVLLDDCAAGETARCVLNGVFGAIVRSDSEMTFASGETAEFFKFAAADFSLEETPPAGVTPFKLVSTRNNAFDRWSSRVYTDFGLGCPGIFRIISHSDTGTDGRFFAYLVPNERRIFLGSVTAQKRIGANSWIYKVSEVRTRFSSTYGTMGYSAPTSTTGDENVVGWAYNANEPGWSLTRDPEYSSDLHLITKKVETVTRPDWDSEERLWGTESESVEFVQRLLPASGRAIIFGDSFSGWYFVKENPPLPAHTLLIDSDDLTRDDYPQIEIGEGLTATDNGEADIDRAKAEGNGHKALIDWTGMKVSESEWSSPRGGIKEICFGENFTVTVNDGKAIIMFHE